MVGFNAFLLAILHGHVRCESPDESAERLPHVLCNMGPNARPPSVIFSGLLLVIGPR